MRFAGAQPSSQPVVGSLNAVVIDGTTGHELWGRSVNQRMFPASTTKIMTGLLAVEAGDLDSIVTISKRAEDVGETGLDLRAGETMPLRDLLQGALVWSANDACVAIAEAVYGSLEDFVEHMNQRAQELGANDTHFMNPHGLHDPEHYSTSHDLALIAAAAMRQPEFKKIVGSRHITLQRPTILASDLNKQSSKNTVLSVPKTSGPLRGLETYRPREFTNRNRLLLRWDQCTGVKTGYTRQAGRCLVASCEIGTNTVVAVSLKAGDATVDCQNMLQWAQQNFKLSQVVKAGQTEQDWVAKVSDGVQRKIPLVAEQSVSLLVPAQGANIALQAQLQPLQAPVQAKQQVGLLSVIYNGHPAMQINLVSSKDVPLSFWGQVKHSQIPKTIIQCLLICAVGVLLVGTIAKAARTSRSGVAPRERTTDNRRPRERQRSGRDRTRDESRSRLQRNRRRRQTDQTE